MNKLHTPVTVVVPVYGDWKSLSICIDSLMEFLPEGDTVLLVNDCGPDVDYIETNILKKIQGKTSFRYERNEKNLGFVGTCNRAVLELDTSDNDILLLNSDAAITAGMLHEMKELLATNKKVGSLSPRSNNATICTIPINAINEKGVEKSFAKKLFDKYHKKYERYTETPTAHGFCMLIRRVIIKDMGLFDPIFGRGYGEEVDLSQRMRSAGWQTGIANWAFAYHLEARSFSIKTKQQLLETNGKIIAERYPDYRMSVRKKIDELKIQEKQIISNFDMHIVDLLISISRIQKRIRTR